MDLGTVLSAAQTLLAALQRKELKDICSFFKYESQLKDLQRTVKTVNAVLLDAETKNLEELGHEAQHYIKELKDNVYDAEDLFDWFVTLAKKNQTNMDGKAYKKVRRLFLHYKPLGVAYTMSQGVKRIRKKLDNITSNHTKFGFSMNPLPIRKTREETCSYIYENHIVGRKDDVNNVVDHLLNGSNLQRDVSFLSIVGIGGLGKTTLAQLVYNDVRVTNAFSLKIWTCVSDHDQEQFDEVHILRKIFSSITGQTHDGCTKDWLCNQVREKLTRNRFFLVLDDVWTENQLHWHKLEGLLLGGQKESWIVVTSRSHETARIIGNGTKYLLQGLSMEYSWCLFKKMLCHSDKSPLSEELVKIGREIVEGCVGVPLAIKVAATVLYGQDKSIWLSFQKTGMSHSRKVQKDIMHILKFSYHQLESPLKSCFTYCALFPKDYEINKKLLISLWIAQGYIVPLYDHQTEEEVAENYFSILLQRCFLQDVHHNWYGDIVSCKMHDLMHEVAQKVAGHEICITNFATIENVANNVRHLAYTSTTTLAQKSIRNTNIRSYLYIGEHFDEIDSSTPEALVTNWTCLRVLDLSRRGIKNLPKSIGKLLHLRYLDISKNKDVEVLPESIVELYNLETLKIGGCKRLKELPKRISKLVNLRNLEISSCRIKYLTCLETLPCLKTLRLIFLEELEYIICSTRKGTVGAKGLYSFPSLEELVLYHTYQFKGWRKSRVREDDASSCSTTPLLLPQLKSLKVESCTQIQTTLLCPKLEILYFICSNEKLQLNNRRDEKEHASSSSLSSSSFASYGVFKLRKVRTDKVSWLNRMPMESLQCLDTLCILDDNEVKSLRETEVFRSCSTSLRVLEFIDCPDLRTVMSGVLEHLTTLQSLRIQRCWSFSDEEEENDRQDGKNGMILPSLHYLKLDDMFRMECLPYWMQFLANLETLEIDGGILKFIPIWMPKLTSLRKLQISWCSKKLKERCDISNGVDWPLIKHIPSIHISSEDKLMQSKPSFDSFVKDS